MLGHPQRLIARGEERLRRSSPALSYERCFRKVDPRSLSKENISGLVVLCGYLEDSEKDLGWEVLDDSHLGRRLN